MSRMGGQGVHDVATVVLSRSADSSAPSPIQDDNWFHDLGHEGSGCHLAGKKLSLRGYLSLIAVLIYPLFPFKNRYLWMILFLLITQAATRDMDGL